jgi:hypothetical protein
MPLTAITTSNLDTTNSLFFRNRIINGAMVIDQRYAGSGPNSVTGGAYSVDRWGHYYSGPTYTSQQSTTAPAGFANSLLMTNTSASGSPTYCFFGQRIEGYNIADLNFGTANASAITVSFWVRSSVTGIYSISITNDNGDRAYPAQYTINSANTFEYKTITIPGETTGTWLKTNGVGLYLRINLGSPSGRLATAGSWQNGNYDGASGSTGAASWANTLGATFYITGVQLEVGTAATAFERRPYGTELQLCQRYYQTYTYMQGPAAGVGYIRGNATGSVFWTLQLRQPMRTTPSEITLPTIGSGTNNFTFLNGEGYPATFGSLNSTQATLDHIWFYFSGFSTLGSAQSSSWAYSTGTIVFRIGAEL